MNSLTKNLADFGTKMKTGTVNLKQKGGELTAKAGAAIVDASRAIEKNIEGAMEKDIDDPTGDAAALAVPSVVDTIPNDDSEEFDSLSPSKQLPGVHNVHNSLRGFASQFKRPEEPVEVSDLHKMLGSLFDFDPAAKKQHEMVEALDSQSIHTFRGFLLMAEEDIPFLTKITREGEIPISQNSLRMLMYLKQFTIHNINAGVPTAKDPAMYTQEAFDKYVEDLQMGRKSVLTKEELEEENKPSKLRNVRDGISGFASKFKPEDGSIGDILSKAKAKVLHRKGGDKGSQPSDEISVGAASSASAGEGDLASVPGDISFETMQRNVDDLASELEHTTKNVTNKEEAQKLMVPLLAKLKKSQDRFGSMIENQKKKHAEKKAEKEAEKAAGTTEDGAEGESEEKKKKLKNLLSSAENATKRAFENAEKVARQAATKAGILDDEKETEAPKDAPEPTAAPPAAAPPAVPATADEPKA